VVRIAWHALRGTFPELRIPSRLTFYASRLTFLTICPSPAAIPCVGKSSRLFSGWRSAWV